MQSVTYVRGDITREEDMVEAFQGADVVFNVASPDPQKTDTSLFNKINVEGTRVSQPSRFFV